MKIVKVIVTAKGSLPVSVKRHGHSRVSARSSLTKWLNAKMTTIV